MLQQSQSNSRDQQNRPGSQGGYGAPVGSAPGSGTFPGAELQGEPGDPSAYSLYATQAHNGQPGEY